MGKMVKAAAVLLRFLGPTTGSAPSAAWSELPTLSMGKSMGMLAPDAARASLPTPPCTPTPSSTRATIKEGTAKGGKQLEAKATRAKEEKAALNRLLQEKFVNLKSSEKKQSTSRSSNSWKPRKRGMAGDSRSR